MKEKHPIPEPLKWLEIMRELARTGPYLVPELFVENALTVRAKAEAA